LLRCGEQACNKVKIMQRNQHRQVYKGTNMWEVSIQGNKHPRNKYVGDKDAKEHVCKEHVSKRTSMP
jgi:hypothetical protein